MDDMAEEEDFFAFFLPLFRRFDRFDSRRPDEALLLFRQRGGGIFTQTMNESDKCGVSHLGRRCGKKKL